MQRTMERFQSVCQVSLQPPILHPVLSCVHICTYIHSRVFLYRSDKHRLFSDVTMKQTVLLEL